MLSGMSLIRKIFGNKSSDSKKVDNQIHSILPTDDASIPLDERFAINFKINGGKFLYCESMDEVYTNFKAIQAENNWSNELAFTIETNLATQFKQLNNFKSTKQPAKSTYLFSTCEYLISNEGAILISSNQIAESRLSDIPLNYIIFAKTSQIIETIDDAMTSINLNNKRDSKKIPTNITSLKYCKAKADESNFLNYGSSSKNLYLLLLEDL